jgi:hypothetical protein
MAAALRRHTVHDATPLLKRQAQQEHVRPSAMQLAPKTKREKRRTFLMHRQRARGTEKRYSNIVGIEPASLPLALLSHHSIPLPLIAATRPLSRSARQCRLDALQISRQSQSDKKPYSLSVSTKATRPGPASAKVIDAMRCCGL